MQSNLVTPPPRSFPAPSRRLAITLGDPAGIGPEVILKALARQPDPSQWTIVGSRVLLQQTYDRLMALEPQTDSQTDRPPLALAHPDRLTLLDVPLADGVIDQIQLGQGNAASGEASFRYLTTAIDRTLQGEFGGIVTAPIAKSAWKAAGHAYPGQTELLAEKAGVQRYGMLFVARSPQTQWTLRALLATTHIPLSAVPTALTPALMSQKLALLIDCLQQAGISQPRIAIAGLNPHSGEQGQLGREELDWLIPWMEAARQQHPQAHLSGPIPPDTMWVAPGQAWYHDRFAAQHDAYLALYHDQGLIPVKLMAFDQAVNTTIGLPFLRTSPDHGTAFDIAGRGLAKPESFLAALSFAEELAAVTKN